MGKRVLALRKDFTGQKEGESEPAYGKPRELNENLFKNLFQEPTEQFIVSSTPKVFSAIHKDDFTENFYLSDEELEAYAQGMLDVLTTENIVAVQTEVDEEAKIDLDDIALDDKDIKLSLYRSFKSIYDKWISNSGKTTKNNPIKGYFFNNYGQDDDRTLFDHFNFINRGGSDVGGQAVIDPSMLSEMISTNNGGGPTESLYQVVTNILSKNNFDFFPLPTYAQFKEGDTDSLKEIFEASSSKIGNVLPKPSFLCVYIGGNSRILDIPRSGCNSENKIAFDYGNDGFDINDPTQYPKDISDGFGLTAFKVKYGQEAQNHFKKIELDQQEFKETQESLLVIDALANPKQGNSPSQSGKGNNIYDMYLTRGYTCTVTMLGNLQIQPLMYFQLENVPMFRGTYLITNVKHTVKPHNVETVFKGTRQPFVQTPLVVDPISLLDLALSEDAIEGERQRNLSDFGGNRSSGSPGSTTTGPGSPITNIPTGSKNGGSPKRLNDYDNT